MPSLIASVVFSMLQMYQPTEKDEEQEDVKIVKESKEDTMKEYEKAALRLDKAKLVCILLFKAFHCCLELCPLFLFSQIIVLYLLSLLKEFGIAKIQMNDLTFFYSNHFCLGRFLLFF